MNEILRASTLCSQLGYLVLNGNTEAVKCLYGYLWTEHPALVRTISQLQTCLTSVEIEQYADKIYSSEFLYYWGMICLGEQSSLLIQDLETAETCFHKIKGVVPVVTARLAYIDLLQSDCPAKSECNIVPIEALRKCGAYQRDMFSLIVLSKITFYGFLEQQRNGADNTDFVVSGLPIRSMRLLEWPCQQGHPVAIRFWNSMVGCLQCPAEVTPRLYPEDSIQPQTLYDYKTSANMQIGL